MTENVPVGKRFKSLTETAVQIGVPEGLGAVFASHPFDTIIVRLQTAGKIDLGGNELLYDGPWDCFTKILRREGFFSLYKGMMMPALSTVPLHLLSFYVYNDLQVVQTDSGKLMRQYEIMRNGAVSGGLTAPFVTPIERIKFCLQVTDGYHIESRTTFAIIREIFHTEGVYGFFRGTILTCLRDSISMSLGFVAYFWMKFNYLKSHPHLHPSGRSRNVHLQFLWFGLTGGIAGIIATLPVIPIDYMKTQYQDSPTSLKDMLHGLRHKADRREIGVLRLTYTGTPIVLAKAFCQFSMLFLCFEIYNLFILNRKKRPDSKRKKKYEELDELDELYDRYYDI